MSLGREQLIAQVIEVEPLMTHTTRAALEALDAGAT
jgi:hypothetical protein